jgi:lycopene elongase/hydratase (dihydrobisanhydrobacterioruberin-forming)
MKNLFLNHADAYLLTLIIAGSALVLHEASSPFNICLVGALVICYWWGFALNDYYDAPFDSLDADKGQRNFFVQHPISARRMALLSLLLLAPVAALFFSLGWRGFLAFGLGIVIMWGYSAPPLRLKNRAGLDLWAHMLFVQSFPYGLMLFVLQLPLTALDILLLLFFLLGSITAQLEQQIRDFPIDSQQETNFTVRFGLKTSVGLLRALTAAFILIVCGAVYWGIIPLWLIPYTLIGLPILLHRFLRHWQAPRSEWLVRLSIISSVIYTGLAWGLRLYH